MGFRGWTAEAIEFYEGLEADNSKTYWNANKSVYENLVLGPMTELLAELGPEFGETKLFRPYRDVRFSADKAPYKTAIGATLGWGGYVQLSAEGLAAGSGMWRMAPDQLERYRKAVSAETTGKSLVDLLTALRAAGFQAEGHDSLRRRPRAIRRTTRESSCCATRASPAGSSGRQALGWASPVPRIALSVSCGRHSPSMNGSRPT